ncbi:MAG: hypothetical protein NT001_06790 [Candidatus Woesearchaeota archaeon]|nr:hypothetical protein [Candidatus Woesearchaeota archaeon]
MVILFDQYNLPNNIYETIFATEQQAVVAKLLIEDMKSQGGEIGKTEMSIFANKLHEGTLIDAPEHKGPAVLRGILKQKETTMSYNKRQFYDRILTPMKAMGMIDYDLYKKRYRISDSFNKALTKIGIMWSQEVRKKPL